MNSHSNLLSFMYSIYHIQIEVSKGWFIPKLLNVQVARACVLYVYSFQKIYLAIKTQKM